MANKGSATYIHIGGDTKDYEKALERANRATERASKSMKQAKVESKDLGQSFSKAANQVTIFNGQLDPISGRLSAIGTGITRFGVLTVAGAAAVGGLVLAVRQMILASEEYETRQNRFNALLQATSNASKLTRKDLEDLANSIGRDTLSSTEEAEKAIRVLLTFKKVQGDTFKESIKLARDMQVALGTDLRSATLQLGKALNDPVGGLGALSRAGVQFTAEQKEMINSMWEVGDAAKAQAVILEELRGQIGGLAQKEGTDLANQLDLLGHNWDRMWESLGRTSGLQWYKESNVKGLEKLNKLIESITGIHSEENIQLREKQELVDNLTEANDELIKKQNELKEAQESFDLFGNIFGGKFAVGRARQEYEIALGEFNQTREEYVTYVRGKEKEEQEEKDKILKAELQQLKDSLTQQESLVKKSYEARLKAEQSFASGFESQVDKVNRVYESKLSALKESFDKEEKALLIKQKNELEIAEKEGATEQERLAMVESHRAELIALKNRFTELEIQGEQGRQAKLKDIADRERGRQDAERLRQRRAMETFANAQKKALSDDVASRDANSLSLMDLIFGNEEDLADKKQNLIDAHKSAVEEILASNATLEEKRAAIGAVTTKTNVENAKIEAQQRKKAASDTWGALETLGASGSKKLFAIEKAAKITQAIMNTYTAATNALASVPFPYNIAAASLITASGFVQVRNIKNQQMPQFHDGIDYVPRTGTYLIEQGERVVDKRLNGDLKEFINTGGRGLENLTLQIPDTGSYNATEQWYQDNRNNIIRDIRRGIG